VTKPPSRRDVIKDDFGGKLPSGRPFRPDVRGRRPDIRARLRVFTVRRRGKNRVRADACVRPRRHERVRADAAQRPCEKKKKKKKKKFKNKILNFG
jgi:hypothetical protein